MVMAGENPTGGGINGSPSNSFRFRSVNGEIASEFQGNPHTAGLAEGQAAFQQLAVASFTVEYCAAGDDNRHNTIIEI